MYSILDILVVLKARKLATSMPENYNLHITEEDCFCKTDSSLIIACSTQSTDALLLTIEVSLSFVLPWVAINNGCSTQSTDALLLTIEVSRPFVLPWVAIMAGGRWIAGED